LIWEKHYKDWIAAANICVYTNPQMSVLLFSYKQNRAALEISGAEAASFLNDILTSQLEELPSGKMQMACLLSPQGRILHDMLIFRQTEECFWIETEISQLSDLKKRLMMYRLRRPISISSLENWRSAHLYLALGNSLSEAQIASINDNLDTNQYLFSDSRRPELGVHLISKENQNTNFQNGWMQADLSHWDAIRIANMTPLGNADLISNRALMLEAGLDLLAAVDFNKGCYIGQEVTARTKYRGLVKKRLVPIYSSTKLEQDMPIYQSDKEVGITLSNVALSDGGYLALAMVRTTAINHYFNDEETLSTHSGMITIQLPHWLNSSNFREA